MKRISLALFVAVFMLIKVSAAPVFKYEKVTPVTDSITLTTVEEFYSEYNMTYSYIKADLSDEYTSLELLKSPSGADIIETVKNLAQTEENTVAALNADFFSVYSGLKSFALGMEIKDGKLLQSPINPDTMATVFYDSEKVAISYLDFHIMAVAPNWQYNEIRHLNKHTSYYGDILMYTSDFNGGMSPAPGGEVVEVVVEDGIITEFRRNMPPVKIPENGCVLVVSEGVNMFFANNFVVGDEIKFDYYITPDIENVKTAFGGGAVLVSEGKAVTEYSHTVAGFNPRSAVGIDESGTVLYLVAVDGRQESSKGMRMSHLADLLVSIGCYSAVNLDGGGSTNLIASTLWNDSLHIVNSPSQSGRKVINAVGITFDKEKGEPSGILVESEKNVVFVGHTVKLSAVLHDESFRKLQPETEIEWFSNGGKIENGIFYPEKEGVAVIEASYGDIYGETEILVIDTVSGIVTDGYIHLNKGEKVQLKIGVFDADGNFADVEDKGLFKITSSSPDIVSVNSGIITAHANGTAVIAVEKDNAVSYISVAVGNFAKEYTESFEGNAGFTVVYPSDVKGKTSEDSENVFSGNKSVKISFDFKDEVPEKTVDASEVSETDYIGTDMADDKANDEKDEGVLAEEIISVKVYGEPEKEDVAKAVYFRFDNKAYLHENENSIKLKFFTEKDFNHQLRAQLIDGNGESLLLTFEGSYEKGIWQSLEVHIPEDAPKPVLLKSIYVLYHPGDEKDDGEVYIDNLSYDIAVNTEFVAVPENIYAIKNTRKKGTVFSVGAVMNDKSDMLAMTVNSLIRKRISQSASGVLIENTDEYLAENYEDALIIKLNTSDGGIRATDYTQWDKLVEDINLSEKDNVFIVSENSIFGDNEFENKVICDYLAHLDKNVFVVTGGDRNTYMNVRGVGYFTLANKKKAAGYGNPSGYRVIEFYLGNTVRFEFKPIL